MYAGIRRESSAISETDATRQYVGEEKNLFDRNVPFNPNVCIRMARKQLRSSVDSGRTLVRRGECRQ